jgi:glutamate synthase (NADPH/NADH) small chain
MGKATGFLDYEREMPGEASPLERISHWNEFSMPMAEDRLQQQGARCMDCGTPFCHYGDMLAGMSAGCPLNNLIPEFNDLLYRGCLEKALQRLHKTNNFPEFTGRVCPAPCEGSCTAGLIGMPVTIKTIEKTLVDRGFQEGWIKPEPPLVRTGKKVAIVGSGPAGLACAAQLNKAGHEVTVYERADRIGGLLMYGIPNMKLDKGTVQRRVNLLAEEGIRFLTNVHVGVDIHGERLKAEHDAVVLCGGATKARDLQVEGRQLHGVYQAMDFLSQNTKSLLDSGLEDGAYISAKDKDVIVIGGGDTGTDCVATAIRHGCRSVIQLEIMPQAPRNRSADNPWPQWPKVLKTDYGQQEAVQLYGGDPRQFTISTRGIISDGQGAVQGVETVQLLWQTDGEGHKTPTEVPGSAVVRPAQLVLLALGFTGPEEGLLEQLDIQRDARSNVKAEYGEHTTNVAGVFAAGDMRRGQSLVAWAIAEGRKCAREVDRYLMGGTQLP